MEVVGWGGRRVIQGAWKKATEDLQIYDATWKVSQLAATLTRCCAVYYAIPGGRLLFDRVYNLKRLYADIKQFMTPKSSDFQVVSRVYLAKVKGRYPLPGKCQGGTEWANPWKGPILANV